MKKQEKETPTDATDKVVKAGDDFTIIEGIGSRVSYVLYENDILFFSDLAALDIDFIKGLMAQYRFDWADPTMWREQAQLAADGKMVELHALKAVLKQDK